MSKDGKKTKETVSITAYYKRSLKPELDAFVTLMQRDMELQRRLQPPNPLHVIPPQGQMPSLGPPHAMNGQGGQGGHGGHGGGKPAAKQGGGGGGGGGEGGGQKGAGGGKSHGAIQVLNGKNGKGNDRKKYHSRPRSRGSSHSSCYSDSFSDSDRDSCTTPYSSESSRGRRRSTSKGQSRHRKERAYHEGPGHYGITTGVPLHKLRRHSVHQIMDDFAPGAPLPMQVPRVMARPVDIEQIKAEAYEMGRTHEMIDSRDRIERITELALARSPSSAPAPPALPPVPMAPAPAFLQRRPTVRLVHAGDVGHRFEDEAADRLDRFHFDDSTQYDPRYSDAAIEAVAQRQAQAQAQQAYEDRIRREEDIIEWEEEQIARERDRERWRRQSDYLRRHDSAPNTHLFDGNPNPFSPRPGVRRRATAAGATFYDDI